MAGVSSWALMYISTAQRRPRARGLDSGHASCQQYRFPNLFCNAIFIALQVSFRALENYTPASARGTRTFRHKHSQREVQLLGIPSTQLYCEVGYFEWRRTVQVGYLSCTPSQRRTKMVIVPSGSWKRDILWSFWNNTTFCSSTPTWEEENGITGAISTILDIKVITFEDLLWHRRSCNNLFTQLINNGQ